MSRVKWIGSAGAGRLKLGFETGWSGQVSVTVKHTLVGGDGICHEELWGKTIRAQAIACTKA